MCSVLTMGTRNHISFEAVLRALGELGITFRLVGPERPVVRVCSLLKKEPQGLYYFTGEDPSLFETLQDSVVICRSSIARATDNCSCIAVDDDPQVLFYRLCAHLFDVKPGRGVHPTAIIHPEAQISASARIGAYSIVGRSTVEDDCVIHSHVVIMDSCHVGRRVVIEAHCCLGASGAVWVWDEQGERLMLPQVGGVRIGDDVFLGSDVTVVRGSFNEETTVGAGTVIAPGSKIGHSVVMGENCHLANNVSIAGSAVIGSRSFLGSGCSVRSHAKLAPGTIVGAGAVVVDDVKEPGMTIAGVPARPLAPRSERRGVPRQGLH